MKIKVVWKRWWSPPYGRFMGITLYPFVFLRKGVGEVLIRHEIIHCWQVQKEGWFKFYLKYLWHAIIHAYRRIPAEKEAYRNAEDPNYLPENLEKLVQEIRHG